MPAFAALLLSETHPQRPLTEPWRRPMTRRLPLSGVHTDRTGSYLPDSAWEGTPSWEHAAHAQRSPSRSLLSVHHLHLVTLSPLSLLPRSPPRSTRAGANTVHLFKYACHKLPGTAPNHHQSAATQTHKHAPNEPRPTQPPNRPCCPNTNT